MGRPATAWLLLGIGLIATVLASLGARQQLRSTDEARFLKRTEVYRNSLLQELDRYTRLLNDARALWAIHPPVARDEWRAYVDSLALSNSFPGLRALGFVERVPSAGLPGFLEQVRRDGSRDHDSVDFQVHPQTTGDEHYVVKFIEPLDSNRPALGYDIGSEPNRRQAAETARDTGRATLTRKLTLVQAPQPPGVLLLLPVYSTGIQATNAALRRADLLGWVDVAFVVEELLARVHGLGSEEVDVQVFDGTSLLPATRLTPSQPPPGPGAPAPRAAFERTTSLEFGNCVWTLCFRPGPAFARTPWFAAPGHVPAATLGLSISLLVFGIARSMAGTRQRAQVLADKMTAQLRLQEYAMASAKNGLFILDARRDDCPIIYANPAFQKMTGYSVEEPLGEETLFLLRNGAIRTGLSSMHAILQEGGADHTVVREYRRDGSQFWAEFRLLPVLDEHGQRTHFLGIVEDVTERKRAEEQLRRAEQRYHDLIKNLPVGIYRNTPGEKGHFIEVNPAIVAMFEAASKEELIGHSASDLYADPVRRKELSDKITRQGFVKDEEVELKTLRGRRFWASVTATMQTDAEGTAFFDGVVQDIADRKRAEQALRASQEDLKETLRQLKASHEELQRTQRQLIQAAKMESVGTLAAGVAHEVKNPLQTILMGLDYLGQSLQQPAQNVELALSDMREAVLRADTIVRELLQLSRDTDFELIEGDFNKVVERCLRLMNAELGGTRTKVVRRLEPDLPSVQMDARKMEQVLLNLFINALQAMKQGGTLLLATRSGRLGEDLHLNGSLVGQFRPGERLVVAEVQDSGPGIAPDHLARIFDPFFTTKPVGVGTGLGLSVVKKIIDLHQGAIEVRNVPDGGVVVTLALRA